MITPMLQVLSAPVASPMPVGLQQLAVMFFCGANKSRAACASYEHGAAVPWNLYRLKSGKRNHIESDGVPFLVRALCLWQDERLRESAKRIFDGDRKEKPLAVPFHAKEENPSASIIIEQTNGTMEWHLFCVACKS